MFNQEKSCSKNKLFANNNADSKTNEILYNVKLNVRVINAKERFRF